jgi:Fe-S-cluster containining protein
MPDPQLQLFIAQRQAFLDVLDRKDGRDRIIDDLSELAFDAFEQVLEAWSRDLPPLDCHKGCSPCCILRVVATAPEILVLAHFIRTHIEPDEAADLIRRIREADAITNGLGEAERMAARQPCPFVIGGVCVIYPVRPLACRGHAAFDAKACAQAAKGRDVDIPISEPHLMARSFIQNPLHAALFARNLAWGAYELNQALLIALADDTAADRWLAGEDVFRDALAKDMPMAEMAQAFRQM